MATFVGLDLAWGERNPSGGAVLDNGRLVRWRSDLGSLEEIVSFIEPHLHRKEGTIVAVDAPLRVPNVGGTRPCDRDLSAEWRRFEAGAHPANRRLLARDGEVRGESLVRLLVERHRFTEATAIPKRSKARLICEVYPHPAHISFFGLAKSLKYKRGRVEERRRELARYQALLRSLRRAEPPLKKSKKLLTRVDVSQLRGRALKAYEDALDALSCAYIAWYLWWHGPRRARSYGTLADGSIVVPVTKQMNDRLKRKR